MFESLSARLQGVTERLRGKARITEADLEVALREIRLALLEADVNFKVVKDFVARVRERAVGADLLSGLNPGQQIVKIVHDELVVDDLHDLLTGVQPAEEVRADRPLAHTSDEVLDDLEVDVRLEQGEPNLAQRDLEIGFGDPR